MLSQFQIWLCIVECSSPCPLLCWVRCRENLLLWAKWHDEILPFTLRFLGLAPLSNLHIEHGDAYRTSTLIAGNVGWFQFVAGSSYQVPRLPQFKILNKTSQEPKNQKPKPGFSRFQFQIFFIKTFKIIFFKFFLKKSWLGLDMLLVWEKIKSRFWIITSKNNNNNNNLGCWLEWGGQ